jgi:hypothetical protein
MPVAATVRGFTADSFSGTAVNGDLTVEAPGDLHMTAANAVNGSVRVTAGGLLTTNPFITAASTGLVDLSANGIVINPNSGFVQGGTINLDGGTGDVLIYSGLSARNGTSSGGVVSVSAAGDILVANTASIIASQSGSAGLATVTLGGGSITPGSVTVLGSVSALGNATLVAVRAGNLISIDGALRAITPALDNVGGTILLSDATTIAGAGLVQAARLQVTGAGGDVFLSDVQTPSFEISSTPGLVDVTNTAPAATLLFAGSSFGSSVIFQTSGSLEVLNSTSNLQIGGNAEFRAGGSLTMRDNLTANGDLYVQAGGLAQFGRVAPSPTFSAANITVLTGGTVSIISATMDAATVTIDAGTDVLLGSTLGSVNLVSTGQTQLSAGGRILSSVAAGNGLIDAGALSALAGNTIDFGNLDLIVHNGVATPVVGGPGVGDPALITELFNLGAIPSSALDPNLALVAPNGISLGFVDFFGDYLYLKSDTLTLNQAIGTWLPSTDPVPGTVNPNVVVQMQPFDTAQAIAVEDAAPTSPLAGTTYFTNSGHFSRFPGTSIMVGGSAFGGAIGIGQNGSVNIGGQNFLAATTATVSGIGNIVSTGLVGVAGTTAPPPPPPPTSPPTTSPPPTTTTTSTSPVSTVVQQTTTTTNPTDPMSTTITEETVEANVPLDETQTAQAPGEEPTTSDTPPIDEPIDMVALLEQQPLIEGQVEVNGTVLTCR